MKTYTVYRLENVVTKKNYIGMTSLEPKRRWNVGYHGKMGDAIQQFPFDLCWKKHIEFQTADKKTALELESELMKWYDSVENGYNMSDYGSRHFNHHSEETKRKMSEARSGENNPFYGKHHTEETKKKIRESNPSKSVLQFSKDGEFISEYQSTREAERQTDISNSSICRCCKGKQKSAGGFIWKYAS